MRLKKNLPSYDIFKKVWREDYPHLKIPRACRLGRCDECVDFEERLKHAKGQDRLPIKNEKARHDTTVKKEREEMRRLQQRAIHDPTEWTSLSTDWYFIVVLFF